MNIADAILFQGRDDAPALLQGKAVVTYHSLRDQVGKVAALLLARGHKKGDRIGIFAENSPFFVSAYLGTIKSGCVCVPFQTDLSRDTFASIVANADIGDILVSKRFEAQVRGWADDLGVTLLGEKDAEHSPSASPASFPDIDPVRDLAALMFTSGSTGTPKGVMVSHGNIDANSRDIVSYLGLGEADRAMVVLPFHYCFGASLLHTHLMAGGSLVLNNAFKLFPEAMLVEMRDKACTGFAGVPSTYQLMLRKSRFRQMTFPSLRWFQQAGGKLPNAQIAEVLGSFPQVRYFLMYGQTEATARLSYLPPERLTDKLGSIGQGLPSTRLEVLKADGASVAPGTMETGEIVASGPNVTLGYWKDPVETAKYFRQGRLHTGDIARVDADGFIFIVEREREMIKSGGNRVSAKEVEEAIAEISSVVEVAVVGWPHDLLGESIKAFVVGVPGSGLTAQAVKEHSRKRLPAFKVPEEVVLLDHMPHNDSGKVVKAQLREILARRAAMPQAAEETVSNGDPAKSPDLV